MSTAIGGLDDVVNHTHRVRLCISFIITIGLSSLILWGLVSIYDPQAKLTNLTLRNNNDTYSTINLDIQLTNRNYFRGFNYTEGGWIQVFYVAENEWRSMNFNFTPVDFQGFRKTLNWSFEIAILVNDSSMLMKSQEQSHVYVSLLLTYWYKILLWTTQTSHFQWLDAHAYLDRSFDLKEVAYFNLTKDFTMTLNT